MRWIGHRLHAETDIVVAGTLTVVQAHEIAVEAEHRLLHAVPHLAAATIHTDPDAVRTHDALAHHR
jgi:divalent metal cation (Fe/Co/Zn/Cd) transporter